MAEVRPIHFRGETTVYHALDTAGRALPDSAMPVRIDSDGIVSVWAPTDEERKAIAAGANIELKTYGNKTPPLSMIVRSPERVD